MVRWGRMVCVLVCVLVELMHPCMQQPSLSHPIPSLTPNASALHPNITPLHSTLAFHPPAGIWHALRTITNTEGPLALYKGLGPTLLGVAPYAALNFSAYDLLKTWLYQGGRYVVVCVMWVHKEGKCGWMLSCGLSATVICMHYSTVHAVCTYTTASIHPSLYIHNTPCTYTTPYANTQHSAHTQHCVHTLGAYTYHPPHTDLRARCPICCWVLLLVPLPPLFATHWTPFAGACS